MRDDPMGLEVVGYVDTSGEAGAEEAGLLGPVDDIEAIVENHRVQELILLPGAVSDERLAECIDMGRRRVLDVTVVTDHSGLLFQQATVSDLAGRPVIKYPRDTRYAVDRFVKRLTDVTVGALFVVVSVVAFVVYSVYALSRGRKPLTYSDRLGLEGEPFALPAAGDGRSDGPSDFVNFPLFWLVLTGKMSIVGPYPLPPGEAGALGTDARFRFEVRPGVTGYWRVTPRRGLPAGDLLTQDADYIRNWSLTRDAKIFLMSLGKLLSGRNRVLTVETDKNKPPRERNVNADVET
jgi:lipopolysaccharide/colanic/teichoic acid biosynthesis glycosyltransferase